MRTFDVCSGVQLRLDHPCAGGGEAHVGLEVEHAQHGPGRDVRDARGRAVDAHRPVLRVAPAPAGEYIIDLISGLHLSGRRG